MRGIQKKFRAKGTALSKDLVTPSLPPSQGIIGSNGLFLAV